MIIGITGKMQSGKDTAADYLISKLEHHRKCSFADPIKQMLTVGLQLTYAQTHGNSKEIVDERYKCTARKMMQTLGTEWGRQMIHKDIWLTIAQNSLDNRRIFADVRFENEAEWFREVGYLIHIDRPGLPRSIHESEAGVGYQNQDFLVKNAGSLKDLYYQLDTIIKYIKLNENNR
jgi:dephospho-CoA kinase